jgi:hypothetical protein
MVPSSTATSTRPVIAVTLTQMGRCLISRRLATGALSSVASCGAFVCLTGSMVDVRRKGEIKRLQESGKKRRSGALEFAFAFAVGVDSGQAEADDGAEPLRRPDGHGSVVAIDDLFHDGEAET